MTATLPKGRSRPKCVSQTCALAECRPDQQHCESEGQLLFTGNDSGSYGEGQLHFTGNDSGSYGS